MPLFDRDYPDGSPTYRGYRDAPSGSKGSLIRDGLEKLWTRHEPYADLSFCEEFARHPDERFWEMYLTVSLLDAGKNLRKREELTLARRDVGPDICINKGTRRIWVEAVSPGPGDDGKPDRVPNLRTASGDELQESPDRQIELRVTTSLLKKRDNFVRYRDKGLIGERDSYIVAISGGQFAAQAVGRWLPHALTAVYPFGEEIVTLDPVTTEFAFRHEYSREIARTKESPIPRTAFQHEHFSGISGLIWSLRSAENFLGRKHDFVYVHNQIAERPIPRRWIRWADQYFSADEGKRLLKIGRRR
jgi:hypothetical protein